MPDMANRTDILEGPELQLAREKEGSLLGIARISLEHLRFEENDGIGTRSVASDAGKKQVKRLLARFKRDRCRRLNPDYWIEAVISPDTLRQILNYNSLESLQPGTFPFLELRPEWTVLCLQGRIRAAAAAEWLEPDDRWWIIKFYDSTRLSNETQRSLREFHDVSEELTSGEIYRNILHYSHMPNPNAVGEWKTRGTEGFQRDLKQLQKSAIDRPLREALEELKFFPGLWSTYLNLHRLLPMRVPEELANYLKHIKAVMTIITNGRPEILDAQTVTQLEGRSPFWSRADANHIDMVFDEGLVFPDVISTPEYEILRERVKSIRCIIPSLRTFHEDCKYLEPMVKLVRRLLSPKWKGTVKHGMKRRYSPPAGDSFPIQTTVGYRSERRQAPGYGFWSAYRQVFLASMREFFGLVPNFKPLKMHKVPMHMQQPEASVLWTRFREVVSTVGFSVPRIDHGAHLVPINWGGDNRGQYPAPSLTNNHHADWRLSSRCGMTDGTSFFMDKEYLFLDNIYSTPRDEPQDDLTSFAVKRDMFIAFFPPFEEEYMTSHAQPHFNLRIPRNPQTSSGEQPSVGSSLSSLVPRTRETRPEDAGMEGTTTAPLLPLGPQTETGILPDAPSSLHARTERLQLPNTQDTGILLDAPSLHARTERLQLPNTQDTGILPDAPSSLHARTESLQLPNTQDTGILPDAPSSLHARTESLQLPNTQDTGILLDAPSLHARTERLQLPNTQDTGILLDAPSSLHARTESLQLPNTQDTGILLDAPSLHARTERLQLASTENAHPTPQQNPISETTAVLQLSPSAMAGSTQASTPAIIEQSSYKCAVQLNASNLNGFVTAFQRQDPRQYGCILDLTTLQAQCIMHQSTETINLTVGPLLDQEMTWFASVRSCLSIIPKTHLPDALRAGELVAMGHIRTQPFCQDIISPQLSDFTSYLPVFKDGSWELQRHECEVEL
ncbi:uncharacterized protein CIMG_12218 [Coccidioides immitis RS]|uniref:Uncharacterized protein n=1 Tax=Coccidioides immitis (strain RS) TaxID=246410 RepID=A0A0D8JTR2_COCIM|nr:uncharacterized protein CIMG_12218 [Coccidioides immitis RS]KJF60725.1 hypothetical protein CIMG_12218 [Coccidioides immitis RS]